MFGVATIPQGKAENELIANSPQPNVEFNDEVAWKISDKGEFTVSSATKFQGPAPVDWSGMIWFKGNIKKDSVCAWMAIQNSLKTKIFLATTIYIANTVFVLCNSNNEDCMCLFTESPFSLHIWDALSSKFIVNYQQCSSTEDFMGVTT